jgi:hypothetical protein
LILLAFFLPLAFYVLVLGIINRRPHPLMVSGPWDFVGILFAASGFLVFGGPFAISTLNENWRVFFVLGPHSSGSGGGDQLWAVWLTMSLLYFVLVLAAVAGLLWLRRKQTAIYNIDLASFEEALGAACARLGLRPARSGTSYLFDPAKDLLAAAGVKGTEGIAVEARPARRFALAEARQLVLMDVDYFRAMRHITLRWSAADSLLRKEVETELANQLSDTPVAAGDLGVWLIILGLALFALTFLCALGLMLYRRIAGI